MSDEEEPIELEPVKRGEIIHPQRDLRLDAPGPITFLDRIVLYKREVLFKAQAAVARAFTDFQNATKDASQAQRELEEELIHNEQWDPNVVRKRYEKQYRNEDEQIEHDFKLAQLERQNDLEGREHEIEMEQARRKAERKRVKRSRKGRASQPQSTSNDFREEAEQILRHGAAGEFMPIAEEFRQKLIAERGGEKNLTDEDLERIELMFEAARRKQESKS